MIITPFAYMASQAVVPGWTPEDLTDILYWFNTGQGIVESGGAVQSWTDAISSRTLSVQAGTGMTYTATDSVVNNQPSIYNDGTMATLLNASLTGDVANGDVYTQIWIGKPDVVGGATYAIWGGNTSTGGAASELAPYISSPDGADLPGYYRFGIAGNGRTNITGTTNTGELVYHIEAFNTPTGVISQYWGTTTPLQSTNWGVNSADRDPFRFEIGGYANSIQYQGRIMEVIVMKSIPTLSELINLQNYIVNKYSNTIDTDAQAFIDAVEADSGALTVTEKIAINNLVTDLKSNTAASGNSFWDDLVIIYPFAGTTAASQKYNLKDPTQYTLTINGTPSFTTDGLEFAGDINDYGETGWIPSDNGDYWSGSLGFSVGHYSQNVSSGTRSAWGVRGTNNVRMMTFDFGGNGYYDAPEGIRISNSFIDDAGSLILNSINNIGTNNVTNTAWKNATNYGASSGALTTQKNTAAPDLDILIGRRTDCCPFIGTLSHWWLGRSFSTSSPNDIATIDGIFNDYQTTMGRNLY